MKKEKEKFQLVSSQSLHGVKINGLTDSWPQMLKERQNDILFIDNRDSLGQGETKSIE